MGQGKLNRLVGVLGFALAATSVFASSTKFTAQVQAILPDGTMRCKVIRFLNVDPEELRDVRQGKTFRKQIDVSFNEVTLPKSTPFRAKAVRLIRRVCVGRKVTIAVGVPVWRKGRVIADVEVANASEPLQLTLVKQGLATYNSDGGPTDNVLSDAEQGARNLGIGMWAKPRG